MPTQAKKGVFSKLSFYFHPGETWIWNLERTAHPFPSFLHSLPTPSLSSSEHQRWKAGFASHNLSYSM